MFLSIIIPAYNEERRIGSTLTKYLSYFHQLSLEFIVVLNGCRDKTLEIVQDFKEKNQGSTRIVNIPEAIGKGGAVREGFRLATGELIGFLDADGSTDPAEYKKLIDAIDGYDGAIASRWKKGSSIIDSSLFREVVSIGFISIVKVLFGLPFADTQCGAKIFKNKVIKNILPHLEVNNMAFDVELLFIAHRRHYKILEVPSRWIDQSTTSTTLGSPLKLFLTSIKMFFTLLSIRIRK